MELQKQKNRQLHIDLEAVATLAMVKKNLLKPVIGLMNRVTAQSVDATGTFNGSIFPFSFILAPNGKKNEIVLSTAKRDEVLDLYCEGTKRGEIVVDEIFEIDKAKRVKLIYGITDQEHPGVKNTLSRLGKYAIFGNYTITFLDLENSMEKVKKAIEHVNAKKITGIVMAARPFHRAHERIIRQTLERTDLLIIFLSKPYMKDDFFPYELRKETIEFFSKNFLPTRKMLIIPLENTYIFAGNNELVLNSIVVKNYGCNHFVIGRNHAGLGLYYEHQKESTVLDKVIQKNFDIETINTFVYCDMCRTLVATSTCPHGAHHHITYNSGSILELLKNGILPPAVLMRREISGMILAHMFPKRFENLSKLFYDLVPSNGLIEEHTQRDFYIALMKLYQTSSLT